jgi:hypothetical protein
MTLLRIPTLLVQISSCFVRFLLLLAELGVTLISVPLLAPLLAESFLGKLADSLDTVLQDSGRPRQSRPHIEARPSEQYR